MESFTGIPWSVLSITISFTVALVRYIDTSLCLRSVALDLQLETCCSEVQIVPYSYFDLIQRLSIYPTSTILSLDIFPHSKVLPSSVGLLANKLINEFENFVMPFKTNFENKSPCLLGTCRSVPIAMIQHPVIFVGENDEATRDPESESGYQHRICHHECKNLLKAYCCRAWKAPILSVSGRR